MSTKEATYEAAQKRVHAARDACVHWDYEGTTGEHECCYEYAEALRARKAAREALLKERAQS